MNLSEGQAVEVAPYRKGRFFYNIAFLDGSKGVVLGLRGTHAVVDIERPKIEGKELPVMALKALS